MKITKLTDTASSALDGALNKTVFPCAFVVIGPSKNFLCASYTFEQARITSFGVTLWPGSRPQTEEFTLSFSRVSWRYQLRSQDGRPIGPVIVGQAVARPNSSGRLGLLMVGSFGALIFVGGTTSLVTHRARRRATASRP
jgi:type VI protein secretion system component Hcp